MALGGVTVAAELIIHPGPTVGYRLGSDGRTLAYLPDHEPALGSRSFPERPPWFSGLRLADGARLLIHDAQYTDAEYAERAGWGHSTIAHAIALASAAGAQRLVTFHHDPAHDDDSIDREMASIVAPEGLDVVVGREGLEFDL